MHAMKNFKENVRILCVINVAGEDEEYMYAIMDMKVIDFTCVCVRIDRAVVKIIDVPCSVNCV